LSRDPIGEAGGRSLYGFVQNDSVNNYDLLGLYKKKGHKVIVEKCEIVIVFGHNYKKDPWQFEFPSTCSAGGLVACWPGLTNGKIPDQHRIGAPTHDDVGYWEAPNPNEKSKEQMENEHNLTKDFEAVIRNAREKARRMTCCSLVTIRFIRDARPVIDRAFPDEPEEIIISPAPLLPPKAGK
jgi:hypothetical protein